MPATQRKQRNLPDPGSYWVIGTALFYVTYAAADDDVLYLEDCRTDKIMQFRRFDWTRCSPREVKPA